MLVYNMAIRQTITNRGQRLKAKNPHVIEFRWCPNVTYSTCSNRKSLFADNYGLQRSNSKWIDVIQLVTYKVPSLWCWAGVMPHGVTEFFVVHSWPARHNVSLWTKLREHQGLPKILEDLQGVIKVILASVNRVTTLIYDSNIYT
jgi:hypothetical protein